VSSPDQADVHVVVAVAVHAEPGRRGVEVGHLVRLHRSGVKHFHYTIVGRLDLMFEAMALEADEGLTLTAYTADPGTPSHDALTLLASWAATSRRESSTESRPVSQDNSRQP
jgi:hypothetical protein